MKILKALGVMSALALSTLPPAAAAGELFVRVPFSFHAAGRRFPAGDYRVADNGNGVIYLQGGGKAIITLSIPSDEAKSGAVPALRFTTDGPDEYLSGVQTDGGIRAIPVHHIVGRELTLSH